MKECCLLLGERSKKYGEIECCHIDRSIACAISVGSDAASPSLVHKGNKDSPNEDAIFACAHEGRIILAVADSHFGQWASHAIITGLFESKAKLMSFESIYRVFHSICDTKHDHTERSETTLALVSIDTATGQGIGVSFGDSSVLLINSAGALRQNIKNNHYVSPNRALSLDATFASELKFVVNKGDILMLFTDGIDECHYGCPETSVQDNHIHELYRKHPHDVARFVSALATLALSGVNGNPGGQDNVAVAATLI